MTIESVIPKLTADLKKKGFYLTGINSSQLNLKCIDKIAKYEKKDNLGFFRIELATNIGEPTIYMSFNYELNDKSLKQSYPNDESVSIFLEKVGFCEFQRMRDRYNPKNLIYFVDFAGMKDTEIRKSLREIILYVSKNTGIQVDQNISF